MDPDALAWSRPGLPLLSNFAGPLRRFNALGVIRLLLTFAAGRVFGAGCGSLQLLNSSHVRERDKLCFGVSWLGVFGMGFFLDWFEARLFNVGFVVLRMVMVISSGNVPFLLLLRVVKS